MQAYEFLAKPQDGVIHIPEEFRSRITSSVRVIILESVSNSFDHEKAATDRKSDLLLAPTLDTVDWKFNRDEANER